MKQLKIVRKNGEGRVDAWEVEDLIFIRESINHGKTRQTIALKPEEILKIAKALEAR